MAISLTVGLYAYLLATIVLAAWFVSNREDIMFYVGIGVTAIGSFAQLVFLGLRWVEGQRPPFSNTFETLVLMSALAGATLVIIMLRKKEYRPLSAVSMLGVLIITLLIDRSEAANISPLVPALRHSFWLTTHVTFSFVSYAAFLLTFVFGMTYLVAVPSQRNYGLGAVAFAVGVLGAGLYLRHNYMHLQSIGRGGDWLNEVPGLLGGAAAILFVASSLLGAILIITLKDVKFEKMFPEPKVIEKLTLNVTKFGFAFLTLCILTGSVWAGTAWGRYWGWDPKETSSLVTWFVFAIYLHLRFTPKWRGEWNMWVAVTGFWCVVFTYFGANYLLKGIHAYAG